MWLYTCICVPCYLYMHTLYAQCSHAQSDQFMLQTNQHLSYLPSAVCCTHYATEEDSLNAVETFGTILSKVSPTSVNKYGSITQF